MKYTHASLSLLLGLVACSSHQTKKFHGESRSIASLNDLNEKGVMDRKVEKLVEGIFHSHLMGQVYLNEFDRILDKDPSKAMKSESYDKLLALRTFVDTFEEEVHELYMDLIMVASHPVKYSPEQRDNAKSSLKILGNFIQGLKTNKVALPENLETMVLGNLREHQTELYDDLKVLKGNITFTDGILEVENNIHEQMVLLRATRMDFHKELANYKVDPEEFNKTLEEQSATLSFKKLQSDVLKLSKEMKSFRNEIGRGTSSATIYPSAGANGNVTGNGFPANTWAITYDDGPGKTSSQVLKNLTDKKIPATFFQLAKQVVALPGQAIAIRDAGMDMACHSYDHAQLTKLGPAGLEKQITTAKQVIESKLGVQVKLYRLPYGAGVSKAAIRSKIAENKMVHVFWNVDTLDWQDKNPQSIYNRAIKQMKATSKNAGVVLFHDIHAQTVTASAMLMDYMNANKINTCTVQGVIDQINEGKPTCK